MALLYTGTIFLSAFLLFLVQPMIGKMLLPLLGGSPSVWNTVMVFFQALLLFGYLYAHLTRRLGAKKQAVVHLGLLALAAATLPIVVPHDVPEAVVYQPVTWLLTTLLAAVGLPFFALSANAPMLQSWLASTRHKDAQNPYFLYAASNAASMLALLGYPVLMEPWLRLGEQTALWRYSFYVLVLGIAACAFSMGKHYAAPVATAAGAEEAITLKRRAWWLLLAFVPSAMLMGTTTIITTDIASAPLLWVIPLALYLLSFVFVFAKKPIFYERSRNALLPLAMFIAVVRMAEGTVNETGLVFIYILLLFCTCMVCHHRLAADKPSPEKLTEFYLMMSLGGVLGGIFAGVLAPAIFDQVWEYPLALALACVLCPPAKPVQEKRIWDVAAPLLVVGAMALFFVLLKLLSNQFGEAFTAMNAWISAHNPLETPLTVFSLLSALSSFIPLIACFLFRERPVRFSLMIGILFVVSTLQPMNPAFTPLATERNFFGVVKVREYRDEHFRTMVHGTTMHGIQSTLPELKLTPGGYYHPQGPFGEFFQAMPAGHFAMLGLGTGGLACLVSRESTLTYYEIDPTVEKFARDNRYFTFLQDCPPKVDVVLGDGRLELARAPDHSFDALVVDVFSSDAIPTHLMTKEAFEVYKKKLKKNAWIAIHVSNRHLNLEPVVSAVADSVGLKGIRKIDNMTENDSKILKLKTNIIILSEDAAVLERFRASHEGWEPISAPRPDMLWTDDFSNILRVIKH